MRSLVFAIALTVVFCTLFTSTASADTLIYDNSNLSYYVYNPGTYIEMLDYGTCPGGRISKFVFDYATDSSIVGTIWIRFYRYTDYFDTGYVIKSFALTNVPSTGGYIDTYEYTIPEADRFDLPAGDFGYSFEFSRSTTNVALASGGTGNDIYYWKWDDFYNDWWLYSLGGSYGNGFSMKIYTAPPVEETTCDIVGYKFNDLNANGIWETNEPDMSGWEIYIDENGDGVYQTSEPNVVTDPNGLYVFENLDAPATYTIREMMQDGWNQTLPGSPDEEYTVETEPNNLYGPYNFGNVIWSGLTQTLYPVADTTVNSTDPDTNFDASNSLTVGKSSSTGAIYRSFLKFDMAQIPEGYEIVSAKLVLHPNFTQANVEVGLWFVSEFWEADEVTWNDQPTSSEELPADTCVIPASPSQWDVTQTADDRYCYNRSLGILLQSVDENNPYYVGFWSSELVTGEDSPHLVVQYAPIFGGGKGTPDEPYQIWTADQMNSIGLYKNRWNQSYKLMDDISMAAYTGSNYNQIGIWSTSAIVKAPFKGVFDGDGHTISDFQSGALFGYINTGSVRNLGLIAPNVYDDGALVSQLEWSEMAECWVDGGSVSGSSSVGGLVGTATLSDIGGCWSSASVNATGDVGGLIGDVSVLCRITDSYAAGSVSGQSNVGGFVGSIEDSVIVNCYATGSVSGTSDVGGFCGFAEIYYLPPEMITGCFWDTQTSGQMNSAGGTGMPTAEMKNLSMFLNAGWDFVSETANGRNNDWTIPLGGGYPVLWYQLTTPPALPTFAGGSGTQASPYRIATVDQLNSIGHNRRLMDKHFRLMNDLDMSGQPYAMIAEGPYAFMGSFDGDMHVIKNITLPFASYHSNVGFVGASYGGYVCDVILRDITVQGDYLHNVGSLVGMNRSGIVQNCHSQNIDVTGLWTVGGLVGTNYWHAAIEGASVMGSVTESLAIPIIGSPAGGIAGSNSYWSHITAAGACIDLTGEGYVGGLVGDNYIFGVISDCYATGTVTGTDRTIGGLFGRNIGSGNTIDRCYAACEIIAPEDAPGVGVVTGSESTGKYTDCFWDEQINGDLPTFGSSNSTTVLIDSTGQTTANMQMANTYQAQGWDFVNIWRICEGMNYPRLKAQPLPVGDFACPEGTEITDLMILVDEWMHLSQSLVADIAPQGAPDGKVNLLDFALFAENWLTGADR